MSSSEPVRAARAARSPSRLAVTLALTLAAFVAGCASAPEQSSAAASAESAVTSAADARVQAAEALAKGDSESALRLLVQAAELDPGDAGTFYQIGSLYESRGGDALAARAYMRAVQLDPGHALALEGLGLRYFAERQLEDARPLLQRAVGVDNALWRSHNALGLIADALGEHGDAVAHYAAALALRPSSAAILNNRGYSRYLAGDLEIAEADFRAALTAEPGYDKAWQNLGLVHARRGDYREALSALQRVVPAHVAANDVGYIAMLSGDYPTAERLFAEAIRLSPRYYETANENAAELRRRRTATLTAVQ